MAAKDTVRRAVRAARAARTEQRRLADAAALAAVVLAHPAVAGAGVVAVYVSTPGEPGTAGLRAGLAARGATVLLPVVVGAAPLAWVVDGAGAGAGAAAGPGARVGGAAGPGRGGGDAAPGHPGLLAGADVVLLPALAATTDGHRLGQGGGHYDRTLAALRHDAGCPLLVALVHDDELLAGATWPVEDHDVRIDAVATSAGWSDVAPG